MTRLTVFKNLNNIDIKFYKYKEIAEKQRGNEISKDYELDWMRYWSQKSKNMGR